MSKLQEIKAKLELVNIPASNSMLSIVPDIIGMLKGSGLIPPHLAAMGKGGGFDLAKGAALFDKIQGIRLRNTMEELAKIEAELDEIDIDIGLTQAERDIDFPYVKAKLAVSKRTVKSRIETASISNSLG